MKELSLNILDIAQNSVKAGADNIEIVLSETEDTFEFSVKDDGCGMSEEFLKNVSDPFCTTRTTRNVGLGIPLLKLASEQTGGEVKIDSVSEKVDSVNHGTLISALFYKNHFDFTPLGDIVSTVTTLIQGQPDIHWIFKHIFPDKQISLDTDELKAVLGEVPLDNIEVLCWIRDYLTEQYSGT